jgi:hypothetical protein
LNLSNHDINDDDEVLQVSSPTNLLADEKPLSELMQYYQNGGDGTSGLKRYE